MGSAENTQKTLISIEATQSEMASEEEKMCEKAIVTEEAIDSDATEPEEFDDKVAQGELLLRTCVVSLIFVNENLNGIESRAFEVDLWEVKKKEKKVEYHIYDSTLFRAPRCRFTANLNTKSMSSFMDHRYDTIDHNKSNLRSTLYYLFSKYGDPEHKEANRFEERMFDAALDYMDLKSVNKSKIKPFYGIAVFHVERKEDKENKLPIVRKCYFNPKNCDLTLFAAHFDENLNQELFLYYEDEIDKVHVL